MSYSSHYVLKTHYITRPVVTCIPVRTFLQSHPPLCILDHLTGTCCHHANVLTDCCYITSTHSVLLIAKELPANQPCCLVWGLGQEQKREGPGALLSNPEPWIHGMCGTGRRLRAVRCRCRAQGNWSCQGRRGHLPRCLRGGSPDCGKQ
jgi:hypothetical protein